MRATGPLGNHASVRPTGRQPAPYADRVSGPGQARLDVLARVGGVLGAVGALAVGLILGRYFTGASLPGTWAYLVAMLLPLGFGLVLLGLLGTARARARRHRRR